MPLDPAIARATDRISKRSEHTRSAYLSRIDELGSIEPARSHLSCGNQAHAYAASGSDKIAISEGRSPNIAIVTAYNDMLSSHQPYAEFPAIIKEAARSVGATAQVAGGVPAMCDGVTQGQPGMELSLFSRDVIAMAASVALSHNTFDAAAYLGVCDKIVPGLIIAAAAFGHIPAVFLPSGPMPSGLPNDRKAKVRQEFAAGKIDRDQLMKAEMASYHAPGTCTFYGTANTNQMLMEFMGLHLPGASFINPGTPLRKALTAEGTRRVAAISALGDDYCPVGRILNEKAFVNGIVGLMATGGSTNLVLHLIAMARAAGIQLDIQDFSDISDAVPLLAKVYPNGLADVNHFHAAGGLGLLFRELIDAGLLHTDVRTVAGHGLERYAAEPKLRDGILEWENGPRRSANEKILRPAQNPFAATGGLRNLKGNLGRAVIKVSAVKPENRVVEAPARIFCDQESVKQAFKKGELNRDCVVVVRFQGPTANGMPELHSLTPTLSVLLDRGWRVALVTDGRMSGASGKVPAAIHVAPEAARCGPIGKIVDGDMIRVDAESGVLEALADGFDDRPFADAPQGPQYGFGRELFSVFRNQVGGAETGASALF